MEAPIPPLLSKIETALRWCRIYQSKGEDIMASAEGAFITWSIGDYHRGCRCANGDCQCD